jgi:hypothetical protein
MKHLAGVIENVPCLGQNLLPREEPKGKIPVRFSALPPLVQTPLVGGKPKQAFEMEETLEQGKVTTEPELPQVYCTLISYCIRVITSANILYFYLYIYDLMALKICAKNDNEIYWPLMPCLVTLCIFNT